MENSQILLFSMYLDSQKKTLGILWLPVIGLAMSLTSPANAQMNYLL